MYTLLITLLYFQDLKFQKKEHALLVKIANDVNSFHNFQENFSVDMQQIKEELRSQRELTSHVIELLTTKSSTTSSSNTISIEEFQKKPKLSGIHQLWWAVRNKILLSCLISCLLYKFNLIFIIFAANYEGKHAEVVLYA